MSSKDYWYQDGRPAFDLQLFQEMGKFVRHFTELDADAWDVACRRFRLDGPGGIDDVAAFCHPNAVVRDEPNIGNFLVGATKLMSGQPLVGNEAAALAHALEDRDNQKTIKSLFGDDSRKE